MSKVYTKNVTQITDRRQRLIKNSLFYITNIEDTWC